eukprot:15980598-Heterocapsa_arctica.AAC.1
MRIGIRASAGSAEQGPRDAWLGDEDRPVLAHAHRSSTTRHKVHEPERVALARAATAVAVEAVHELL